MLAEQGFLSYFGVPLIAQGLVKGVLEIFHRSPLEPDDEWIDFLHTLAGQAAIAIEDAQLFRNLQQSNIELLQAYDATIVDWSRALDLRDKETEVHTARDRDGDSAWTETWSERSRVEIYALGRLAARHR